MNNTKENFRFDINGLRAIAVIAVIVFHYQDSWLLGGFAGVDVFFVISGFLMTKIIFSGIDGGGFNIASFYSSRIKRIIPPLAVVLLMVLFFGYAFIEPLNYQIIGEHIKASLLFISNVTYMNESGYFDHDSLGKYLLHTWSLSVEWQFYIVYPVVILLAKKILTIKNIKSMLLFLSISLFVVNLLITNNNPLSSYYEIYSRAWELLVGGLAYIYPLKNFPSNSRRVLSTGFVIMLIALFFFIDKQDPWPGMYAIFPVGLTYAILLLNGNPLILSNPLVQYIGTISYSMYLVHWPLLVFNRSLNLDIGFLMYLIITLMISAVIYAIIEKKRKSIYFSVFIYVAVYLIAAKVSLNGIDSRVEPEFKLTRQEFRNKFEGHMGMVSSENIDYFNASENKFDYILIGDSHARHFYEYMNKKESVVSFAIDGCQSSKNYYSAFQPWVDICKKRYKEQVDFINAHPGKPVIISQSGFSVSSLSIDRTSGEKISPEIDYNKSGIREIKIFIDSIKETNHKVFIVGDTQGSDNVMFECLAKETLPINKIVKLISCNKTQEFTPKKYNEELNENSTDLGYVYIDPSPALCKNNQCLVVSDNMPVYTDNSHLSKMASLIVGKYVFGEIRKHHINEDGLKKN